MADLGHELTDKKLKELEKRVAEEYRIALADMEEKLRKYLEETEVKRQYWEGLWKAGEITESEYRTWCYNHTMVGKRWEKMRDVLAEDMEHANEIALKIAHKEMPDIYALNANYEMYHIEHRGKIETGFTLYSHDTAEYLLGDQRQLMPKPSAKKAKEIAENKAMQWNKQKIQSAVLQGVLQGENPVKVAQRLQSVAQMNYNDAVRYARTMTTSAQNAGRYEAIHEATRLGVDLTIEWQATLDHRTRHAHRQMHGQRTEVDKPFHTPDGYTIYYPADCTGNSTAPQHEIWNCRCTLLAWVKGYEPDTVRSSPKMGDMTYEEWLKEKPQSKPYPPEPQERTPKEKAPAAKPYSNKEEYLAYRENMKEQWEVRKEELERAKAEEKERLLEEKYGGNFREQRMKVRADESLSASEKERRIDQLDELRNKYNDEAFAIDRKYSKLWETERAKYDIYDLDYEFKKINKAMSLRENVDVVNPNFITGAFEFTNNCQRCAIAGEVRMRGYDVIAEPCGPMGGIGASATVHEAFRTATRLDTSGGRSAVIEVIDQMNEWGNGSRGIISAGYAGGGHVFNVINDNGVIRFLDFQSGSIWGTDEYSPETIYGSAIEQETQTTLYRTDNATFFGVPDGWIKRL